MTVKLLLLAMLASIGLSLSGCVVYDRGYYRDHDYRDNNYRHHDRDYDRRHDRDRDHYRR